MPPLESPTLLVEPVQLQVRQQQPLLPDAVLTGCVCDILARPRQPVAEQPQQLTVPQPPPVASVLLRVAGAQGLHIRRLTVFECSRSCCHGMVDLGANIRQQRVGVIDK